MFLNFTEFDLVLIFLFPFLTTFIICIHFCEIFTNVSNFRFLILFNCITKFIYRNICDSKDDKYIHGSLVIVIKLLTTLTNILTFLYHSVYLLFSYGCLAEKKDLFNISTNLKFTVYFL